METTCTRCGSDRVVSGRLRGGRSWEAMWGRPCYIEPDEISLPFLRLGNAELALRGNSAFLCFDCGQVWTVLKMSKEKLNNSNTTSVNATAALRTSLLRNSARRSLPAIVKVCRKYSVTRLFRRNRRAGV